jgi:AraC family transcriptional regulator
MATVDSPIACRPDMKPLAETIAAVGAPLFMHTVGRASSPVAVIARWRHGDVETDISPSDTIRIVVSLQDGQHARVQTGGVACSANIYAGNVSVQPGYERIKVSLRGAADILQIFLREDVLDAAVEGKFACLGLFHSHDSELRAAAMQLFVAATRGDPDDSLLIDSGIHRIAARIQDDRAHQQAQPARGGLASAAYRRVNDLVTAALDDNMAPSPTLDQLASAACLSVNHFIRAFRQQTGVTPHRHVVLRRLERGITLLKKPGITVAEVADGVGFATPAHFVATFRRTMGVTPGAFQAALMR